MNAKIIVPSVLAVAGAAALGFYLLRGDKATGATAPVRPDQATVVAPLAPSRTPMPAPGSAIAPTGADVVAPPGPGDEDDGESVTVARGDTVATVNGVAITGDDLIAYRAGDGDEQPMSAEMYEFVLRRAIERELTFQAARARKLELTADQAAQIEQVRKNAEERGEADSNRLAFEQLDARAQMLVRAMVDAEGGPPSMPDDAAVDAYLRQHASEYSGGVANADELAQRRIDARQKLYGELSAAYEARVRALLARLEAEARVTRP
jgi:hypothetical protein